MPDLLHCSTVGHKLMRSVHTTTQASIPKSPIYDRANLGAVFLPVKQMLQIDRVSEISGPRLVCEMDITDHWVFPMHFPSDPIFPGSLLIEAAGQAVAIWAWHAGFRGRPRLCKVRAKFEIPVLKQDRVVKLVANVRKRKSVFAGHIDLFVSERNVAQVDSLVILISEPSLAIERPQPSADTCAV